jgi:hypothetical protein
VSDALTVGTAPRPNLDSRPHLSGLVIFVILLGAGLGCLLNGLIGDIDAAHTPLVAVGAFVLLGILTLPAAMLLSGSLYFLLRQLT